MRYKTAKKYYPILVTLWNFRVNIENWWWGLRKYKPIYYLQDMIEQMTFSGIVDGFYHSSLYWWHLRAPIYTINRFVFNMLGSSTGLKLVNQLCNDYDTKLLTTRASYCYTRTYGSPTTYYSCRSYPFGFVKLTKSTFIDGQKEGINMFNTAVFAMLKNEEPNAIIEKKDVLYKGFIFTRKQFIKAARAYKKDLRGKNEA